MDRLERVKTGTRSNSQLKQYLDCGYRFKLERIDRAWQRPAAWFPHGTAVHKAVEEYERSGRSMSLEAAQDVFRESYAEEVSRYCEETPNLEYWFSSGRFKGPIDVERRYHIGLGQVAGYIGYAKDHPDERVWTAPDGTPAIELGFRLDLEGVVVIGYIDLVIEHPKHGVHVRDIKTGRAPGDDLQLAIYAVAVNELYGTEITTGDYWMAKRGGPTRPYDLSAWTKERLTEEFRKMDQGVKAERFEPNPDPNKCGRCGVNLSCPFRLL